MKASRLREPVYWIGLILSAWAGAASGQTFSSGSTGADGAYAPSCSPTPCTVTETLPPSGVFNYTTVTIPAGVTVRYARNAANTPVTILATGDVTINGTISVNGNSGAAASATLFLPTLGGTGGPGGFSGGNGGVRNGVLGTAGQGPGGGRQAAPGLFNADGGVYGAQSTFVALIPLFGGSGGGGGTMSAGTFGLAAAGAGGGGAGAILIASSTKITVAGAITANGGGFGSGSSGGTDTGSGGSGGAIRLVAPQLAGAGTVRADGGASNSGIVPGSGRTRLEAFTQSFAGTVSPTATYSVPGPVAPSSNPALVQLPTLAITSIGSVAVPSAPNASYTTADVSLAQGTANPVPVTVAATYIPLGASFTMKLFRQNADPTTFPVTGHTGTFSSSTATSNVTFPAGQVSVLQAWATYTLTGDIVALMPLIDGEPVEQVMVASSDGKSSTLNLVTASGKQRRLDELPAAEQLKVAQAWQALAARAE